MASELERILLKLEADTLEFRRALRDGENAVERFEKTNTRTFGKFATSATQLGAQAATAIRGLVAAYGAAQIASAAFEAVKATAEIEDQARAANLSTTAFQEMAFAMRQAGGSTEEFASATRKFAINMSQLRAGGGQLNEWLNDYLPSLKDSLKSTNSQEQAFRVAAVAISALADEGDRTTLATKLFGEAGADLVDVLANGTQGLDEMAKKAHELGVIQNDELIESSKQLKKEYSDLTEQLYGFWQRAAVGVAGYVKLVAEALKLPANLDPWAGYGVMRQGSEANPIELKQTSATDRFGFTNKNFAAARMPSKLDTPIGNWTTELDFSGVDAMARLRQQAAAARGNDLEAARLDAEQELETYRRMLADKKISQEEFEEARRLLNDITSSKIQQSYDEEAKKARETFSEVENLISTTFMSAFSEALQTGSFNAKKFFADIATGFAEVTMQALVLKPILDGLFGGGSTGPASSLMNMFGGLFGGARAAGGPVAAGTPYLVGERGPELFVPNASGRVMANGFGGGAPVFTTVNNIDARGSDISVAQRVERALSMQERNRKDPVSAVGSQSRRFPTRRY